MKYSKYHFHSIEPLYFYLLLLMLPAKLNELIGDDFMFPRSALIENAPLSNASLYFGLFYHLFIKIILLILYKLKIKII